MEIRVRVSEHRRVWRDCAPGQGARGEWIGNVGDCSQILCIGTVNSVWLMKEITVRRDDDDDEID